LGFDDKVIFTKAQLLADLALIEQAYLVNPAAISSPVKLPVGFVYVGTIEVDSSVTARLLALQSSVHLPLFRALFKPDSEPWGYVAYDTATGTVHVSIRGTETELEWAEDAAAILVPCESEWLGVQGTIRIHEGFQQVFTAIRSSLVSLIARARTYTPARWAFRGHSLGSPLAVQARLLLTSSDVASCCLWAAPRTGNSGFAGWWNAITPNCQAVINAPDLSIDDLRDDPDLLLYIIEDQVNNNSNGA
jgi:hypothetical protein